jgi:hypothetical protein
MADDESTRDGSAAASAAVANVSIKLSPFWPYDPEVCFAEVEARFTIAIAIAMC